MLRSHSIFLVLAPPGFHYPETLHLFPSLSWRYPAELNRKCSLKLLFDCLDDIKSWMSKHLLMLNDNKTEIVLFCRPDNINDICTSLGPLSSFTKSRQKPCCVVRLRPQFWQADQLRGKGKLYPIQRVSHDLEKVIHALISSRLDYCNSAHRGCLLPPLLFAARPECRRKTPDWHP